MAFSSLEWQSQHGYWKARATRRSLQASVIACPRSGQQLLGQQRGFTKWGDIDPVRSIWDSGIDLLIADIFLLWVSTFRWYASQSAQLFFFDICKNNEFIKQYILNSFGAFVWFLIGVVIPISRWELCISAKNRLVLALDYHNPRPWWTLRLLRRI